MYDITLFRSLALDKIFQAQKNIHNQDFKAWISSGDYLVDEIEKEKFSILVNNYHSFSHCFFFDASRMASAAFESIQSVYATTSLPRSFAWTAIKTYYAAFFAAHSIMRCFGYACSQLEQGHLNFILQLGSVRGLPSNKLTSGYFSANFNESTKVLSLLKMKNSHEDTWKSFLEMCTAMSKNILQVQGLRIDVQSTSTYLSDLCEALTDYGRLQSGGYLSSMRNAINYRHEFGAWFPYKGSNIKKDDLQRIVLSWNKNDVIRLTGDGLSEEVYKFFWLSTSIVNFCYKLIKDISTNSSERYNPFKEKPIALLQLSGSF